MIDGKSLDSSSFVGFGISYFGSKTITSKYFDIEIVLICCDLDTIDIFASMMIIFDVISDLSTMIVDLLFSIINDSHSGTIAILTSCFLKNSVSLIIFATVFATFTAV